jgi:formylglycine-generating enzyme required for sulfatase activity
VSAAEQTLFLTLAVATSVAVTGCGVLGGINSPDNRYAGAVAGALIAAGATVAFAASGVLITCDTVGGYIGVIPADTTSRRAKMLTLQRVTLAIIAILPGRFAASEDQIEDAVHFTFPVKVDESAGRTLGLPRRVQDTVTEMWFRLVPSGSYMIGSDEEDFSKRIRVELDRFYISEALVTNKVVAEFLLQDIAAKAQKIENDGEGKPLNQDEKLLIRSIDFMFGGEWTHFLEISAEDQRVLSHVISRMTTGGGGKISGQSSAKGIMRAWASRLNDGELRQLRSVFSGIDQTLKQFRSKEPEKTFHPASFSNASAIAEWRGVDLPTEAQWEVAAMQASKDKLPVKEFLGPLQWCSDLYVHDYFEINDGKRNPRPKRARLTPEQLKKRTPPSGFPVLTRMIVAGRLRSVRGGGSLTRRRFSSAAMSAKDYQRRAPVTVRLVYNPRRAAKEEQ